MGLSDFYKFMDVTLMLPCGIPLILILVDEWSFPKRVVYRAAALLMMGTLAFSVVIAHLVGFGSNARVLVGSVPMLFAWLLFFLFSHLRDGRFFFTTATAGLLMSVVTATCSLVFPIGSSSGVWLRAVASVVLLAVSAKWLRAPYLRMVHYAESGWMLLSLVPTSLLLALNIGYIYPMYAQDDESGWLAGLVLCVAAPLLYITFYRFLRSMRDQYALQQNEAVLIAQIRSLEQLTERMETSARKNRIFRHDLRHYLQILKTSVQNGQHEQALQIGQSMAEELGELRDGGAMNNYTGQTLIDAVLSSYAERAEENGIKFTVQLTLPPVLAGDMTELAVVFANALENALYACREQPLSVRRQIKVHDCGSLNPFMLVFENTIDKPVRIDAHSGLPVSERAGHGYGVQSIATFADKNGAQIDYSQSDGMLHLRILFP